MKDKDTCEVRHCRQPIELLYYGRRVCASHWERHCDKKFDLKAEFKIRETDQYATKTNSERRRAGQRKLFASI